MITSCYTERARANIFLGIFKKDCTKQVHRTNEPTGFGLLFVMSIQICTIAQKFASDRGATRNEEEFPNPW